MEYGCLNGARGWGVVVHKNRPVLKHKCTSVLWELLLIKEGEEVLTIIIYIYEYKRQLSGNDACKKIVTTVG